MDQHPVSEGDHGHKAVSGMDQHSISEGDDGHKAVSDLDLLPLFSEKDPYQNAVSAVELQLGNTVPDDGATNLYQDSAGLVSDWQDIYLAGAEHQDIYQDSGGHDAAWQDLSLACAGHAERQDIYQDSGGGIASSY